MAYKILDKNGNQIAGTGGTDSALYTHLLDSTGRKIIPEYAGYYGARVDSVPGTITAGGAIWALKNGAGAKKCYIRLINLNCGFFGTAALSRSVFEILIAHGVTYSGGTAGAVSPLDPLSAASNITDVRMSNTALTAAGGTFEAAFHNFGITSQVTFASNVYLEFPPIGDRERLVLDSNDLLVIRVALSSSVPSCWVYGGVQWAER